MVNGFGLLRHLDLDLDLAKVLWNTCASIWFPAKWMSVLYYLPRLDEVGFMKERVQDVATLIYCTRE